MSRDLTKLAYLVIDSSYYSYNQDEAEFVQAYPQVSQGYNQLREAINAARLERGDQDFVPRNSKNGGFKERSRAAL